MNNKSRLSLNIEEVVVGGGGGNLIVILHSHFICLLSLPGCLAR